MTFALSFEWPLAGYTSFSLSGLIFNAYFMANMSNAVLRSSGYFYGHEHNIAFMYVWPVGKAQTVQIFSWGREAHVDWVRWENLDRSDILLGNGSSGQIGRMVQKGELRKIRCFPGEGKFSLGRLNGSGD